VFLSFDPRYFDSEKLAIPLLKQIPPSQRTYSSSSNWWSFSDTLADTVLDALRQTSNWAIVLNSTATIEGATSKPLPFAPNVIVALQDALHVVAMPASPLTQQQFHIDTTFMTVPAKKWISLLESVLSRYGTDISALVESLGPLSSGAAPANPTNKSNIKKSKAPTFTLGAAFDTIIDARLFEHNPKTGQSRFMDFASKSWAGIIGAGVIDAYYDQLDRDAAKLLPPAIDTSSLFHVLGFGAMVNTAWLKSVSLTADQVKSAYRAKAKLYHPDLCKAPNANILFDTLAEAYKTLLNDLDRERYSRALLVSSKLSGIKSQLLAPELVRCARAPLQCGRIACVAHSIQDKKFSGMVYIEQITNISDITANGKTYRMQALGSSFMGVWE
jgi:hypothetical protein